MKKIDSLYKRNERGRIIEGDVTPGCEWVVAGEGVPTRKWDGTCCLIRDGVLHRRLDLLEGKPVPAGWFHWSLNPEQKSGHGWMPVTDRTEDWAHREAWQRGTDVFGDAFRNGTYELCGPGVQKDPEQVQSHVLIPHGTTKVEDCDRSVSGLRAFLEANAMEGIVWHHADGRMCKIKARDFGIRWPRASK